jgi:hypothetical protein
MKKKKKKKEESEIKRKREEERVIMKGNLEEEINERLSWEKYNEMMGG